MGKDCVVTGPLEPERPERTPLSRRRRKALLFVPLIAVVGIVVALLGVPWQAVAVILGLFVLVMLLEG